MDTQNLDRSHPHIERQLLFNDLSDDELLRACEDVWGEIDDVEVDAHADAHADAPANAPADADTNVNAAPKQWQTTFVPTDCNRRS